MDGGRDHVTAVTADVDVLADLAGGIAHRLLRPFEIDVPAARSDGFDGGGQGAVLRLEPAQRGFGIETVDVDDEDAGCRAGRDGDVVVGLLLPPCLDDVRVRGGVLEAVGRGRPLVARPAREDVESRRARARAVRITAGSLSERDVVVHVGVCRGGQLPFGSRGGCCGRNSSFCRGARMRMQGTVLPCSWRRVRIELETGAGPVVGIVTGDLGDAVPVGHVQRQHLRHAAEVQNSFFFLVVAAAELFLRRSLDLDVERLAA